ncbi:hypothetical protein V6Z11_A08G066200 [Gossypium hirsutum]
MAKKSLIHREKRQKLEQKFHLILRAPTHLHRRCFSTRRPRANYREFGLSGRILREMVHACLLPGVTRSSW